MAEIELIHTRNGRRQGPDRGRGAAALVVQVHAETPQPRPRERQVHRFAGAMPLEQPRRQERRHGLHDVRRVERNG